MNRRSSKIKHDAEWLEAKVAQLHYEKANMRLWKEKDADDAEVTRESKIRNLIDEINYRSEKIKLLNSDREQLQWLLTQNREDLRLLRAQLQRCSAELEFVRQSLSWRLTRPLRQIASLFGLSGDRVVSRGQSPPASPSSASNLPDHESTNDRKRSGTGEQQWGPWSADRFLSSGRPSATREYSEGFEQPQLTTYVANGKEAWNRHGHERLRRFFDEHEQINFHWEAAPVVAFIVVSHGNPHLLLLNLLSIKDNADVSHQVVVVDNGSDNETQNLLEQVHGAKIVKNPTNRGFPSACMQGAACASGRYLCFLNNDALLEPHSISAALNNFSADGTVGAVGGRILQSDGRLQEAGAILWCDGTTNGYGSGEDPEQLKYLFRRSIDYCSGAFLVTPRTLFSETGGFDEEFSPGYYEDVDYCTRLWSMGYQVVYEPRSIIRHYGNASSTHKGDALSIVIRNHEKFYKRWVTCLSDRYEPRGENISAARIAAADKRLRILTITSEIPHDGLDEVQSREWKALNELTKRGFVSCAATRTPDSTRRTHRRAARRGAWKTEGARRPCCLPENSCER